MPCVCSSYICNQICGSPHGHVLWQNTHTNPSSFPVPYSSTTTMAAIPNSMKERMERGEVASLLTVKLVKSVEIVGMAKAAGFDGILIDMEHSPLELETTSQLCNAALYAGIAAIVRVPSKDAFFVSRVLDGGALGVIVPHIRTVQDARDVVAAAKFRPWVTGRRPPASPCTSSAPCRLPSRTRSPTPPRS